MNTLLLIGLGIAALAMLKKKGANTRASRQGEDIIPDEQDKIKSVTIYENRTDGDFTYSVVEYANGAKKAKYIGPEDYKFFMNYDNLDDEFKNDFMKEHPELSPDFRVYWDYSSNSAKRWI